MSRELKRRLVALERATSSDRSRFIVSGRLPEKGNDDPEHIAQMTEAEWIVTYEEANPGTVRSGRHY